MKYVAPTTSATAFNCPHCQVLTSQRWYHSGIQPFKDNGSPAIYTGNEDYSHIEEEKTRTWLENFVKKAATGRPFIEGDEANFRGYSLTNVYVSACYDCKELSVWLAGRLLFPEKQAGPLASPDIPDSIRRDYEEASSIVDRSPRGAAALLRLCIQKLMVELKQPGKNINDDIKALVAIGLDARVQRALDALRVIGNNAVHPGQIDLKDDVATAQSLFKLFNLIIEKLITEPKHVDEVYASLPPTALAAIEARDKPKL